MGEVFRFGLVFQTKREDSPRTMKFHLPVALGGALFAATISAATVADTKFEHGRGFYEAPFEETITTKTKGATLVYTLDGSDPRESATARRGMNPLKVKIDPTSWDGRPLSPGVILRVYAKKEGVKPSNVDTATYLFAEQVREQSHRSPGGGWPEGNRANRQILVYGMNREVLEDPRWKDEIVPALKSIPSMSIVAPLDAWFNTETGLYSNPREQGKKTEIAGSLELIYPDGKKGFQVNTGIRIRGGYSASSRNPKHSYRFFFRGEYGDGKLRYPLFGKAGVDEFDKIDLRTAQNHSWAFENSKRNTFLRDIFCRDLQGISGHHNTKSNYYHAYMNGMYWGLFMTQERAEARFGASYFGGDAADFDVIKAMGWMKPTEVTDGTISLFRELFEKTLDWSGSNADYFALLGRKPDGSLDPDGKILVDPDNLIDYMLGIFYTGSNDEAAAWGGRSTNNFFCMVDHDEPFGFQFFRHDAEHSMDVGWEDRTAPATDAKFRRLEWFNGQTLHERLSKNDEYRLLFADHVHRHLFNNGSMTPRNSVKQMARRVAEVERAISVEAARWGNTENESPVQWRRNADFLLKYWLPARRDKVVRQLQRRGLYPELAPPMVESEGKIIEQRVWALPSKPTLSLRLPVEVEGEIYVTQDGSDPRSIGGDVSTTARKVEAGKIFEIHGVVLKTRTKLGEEWSALRDIYFVRPIAKSALQISEIQYHTYDGDEGERGAPAERFEFVEIRNASDKAVSLTGVALTRGVYFQFPVGMTLEPDGHAVVAADPKAFKSRYGFKPAGKYIRSLSNSGETVTLSDAAGVPIDSVTFSDKAPWPSEADGSGRTLSRKDPTENGHSNDPKNWGASSVKNGSPGRKNVF